jgi:hypothetical protein
MTQIRLRYKCKFIVVLSSAVNAAACFFLFCFIPKQIFINRVSKQLFTKRVLPDDQDIVYFKSGRAALRGFLASLKKINQKYKIIFLPDYICNVIYQAAENAGFSIYSYPTDNTFSPLWNKLILSIRGKSHPVVLLASMFGRVNSGQKQIQRILDSNPEAFIVADECQHLVTNSTIGTGKNMAILFSFNRKTIPGLMGGGICVNGNFSKFIKPDKLKKIRCAEINARLFFYSIRDVLLYIRLFLGKTIPFNIDAPVYDYSVGRHILYDTSPHEIAKLSLVQAWVCLRKLEAIERLRQKNYKVIFSTMQNILLCLYLPEQMRAAFVPITKQSLKTNLFRYVFIKRPYAVHKKPESAIKEIYCLINSIPLPLVSE